MTGAELISMFMSDLTKDEIAKMARDEIERLVEEKRSQTSDRLRLTSRDVAGAIWEKAYFGVG